jgi:L-2-hydroxycarboxylate dehydrogenase (NAD+)
MSLDEYKNRMDLLISRAKASEKAEGFTEIQIPGEPESRTEADRKAKGIPLTPDVVNVLRTEAEIVGIKF